MPLLLEDKPNVVFQHDRAPPHIQYEVTTFLNSCGLAEEGSLPGLYYLQI
jgi:hypothetical protein